MYYSLCRNIIIYWDDKYVHDISLFGIYLSTFLFIIEITGRIYKNVCSCGFTVIQVCPASQRVAFLSCVCLKINLKHIFVSVFNVQTHKHVVQTQPRKQLLSKQMNLYNLHKTSKFLTLFTHTIKDIHVFSFFSFFLNLFMGLRTMIYLEINIAVISHRKDQGKQQYSI